MTVVTELQRVAEGDEDAMNAILDRHGALVWALARRWTANVHDAEEAVQEVFLSVWSSAARYDPEVSGESTFIATIARRRLIDRARRVGRRPELATLDDDGPEPVAPEVERPDRDEVETVHAALEQLKPRQREVLNMSLSEGLTHREIAEQTGYPLGTVKTHARRGLIRLRELLGAEGNPAAAGRRSPEDDDEGPRSSQQEVRP